MKTDTARCEICNAVYFRSGPPHRCDYAGAVQYVEGDFSPDIYPRPSLLGSEPCVAGEWPFEGPGFGEACKPDAQGIKEDGGKPRYDLIDPEAMDALAQVLTFGANKYAAHNWRKGLSYTRLVAAALRHLFAFLRGQTMDPESGLPHVAHAMCNCMFLIWMTNNRKDLDDRFSAPPKSMSEAWLKYKDRLDAVQPEA